jgi:O-antigen ligase
VLAMNEERGAEWIAVHNVYLEYGVDLGVPGLVLFLMVLAGCLKNVRAVQRKTKPVPALREFFYLAGGVEGSLIAFALGAMFHPVAYNFPFYYLAGLSIAATAMFEAGAAKRSL